MGPYFMIVPHQNKAWLQSNMLPSLSQRFAAHSLPWVGGPGLTATQLARCRVPDPTDPSKENGVLTALWGSSVGEPAYYILVGVNCAVYIIA